MKVLSGHLTATQKKKIKVAIAHLKDRADQSIALYFGKEQYTLSIEGEVYTVTIKKRDRGLIPCPGSELRDSYYTSTFLLTEQVTAKSTKREGQ